MTYLLSLLFLFAPPRAATDEPPEYFLVVMSFQDGNRGSLIPWKAHTFATWIEARGHTINKVFTISWLPHGDIRLWRRAEDGVNWTLEETIAIAQRYKTRLSRWGPYRICPSFYAAARRQCERLNAAETTGVLKYQAVDAFTQFKTQGRAIHCLHAVSEACGQPARTGPFTGEHGTQIVVDHFRARGLIDNADPANEWVWEAICPPGISFRRMPDRPARFGVILGRRTRPPEPGFATP